MKASVACVALLLSRASAYNSNYGRGTFSKFSGSSAQVSSQNDRWTNNANDSITGNGPTPPINRYDNRYGTMADNPTIEQQRHGPHAVAAAASAVISGQGVDNRWGSTAAIDGNGGRPTTLPPPAPVHRYTVKIMPGNENVKQIAPLPPPPAGAAAGPSRTTFTKRITSAPGSTRVEHNNDTSSRYGGMAYCVKTSEPAIKGPSLTLPPPAQHDVMDNEAGAAEKGQHADASRSAAPTVPTSPINHNNDQPTHSKHIVPSKAAVPKARITGNKTPNDIVMTKSKNGFNLNAAPDGNSAMDSSPTSAPPPVAKAAAQTIFVKKAPVNHNIGRQYHRSIAKTKSNASNIVPVISGQHVANRYSNSVIQPSPTSALPPIMRAAKAVANDERYGDMAKPKGVARIKTIINSQKADDAFTPVARAATAASVRGMERSKAKYSAKILPTINGQRANDRYANTALDPTSTPTSASPPVVRTKTIVPKAPVHGNGKQHDIAMSKPRQAPKIVPTINGQRANDRYANTALDPTPTSASPPVVRTKTIFPKAPLNGNGKQHDIAMSKPRQAPKIVPTINGQRANDRYANTALDPTPTSASPPAVRTKTIVPKAPVRGNGKQHDIAMSKSSASPHVVRTKTIVPKAPVHGDGKQDGIPMSKSGQAPKIVPTINGQRVNYRYSNSVIGPSSTSASPPVVRNTRAVPKTRVNSKDDQHVTAKPKHTAVHANANSKHVPNIVPIISGQRVDDRYSNSVTEPSPTSASPPVVRTASRAAATVPTAPAHSSSTNNGVAPRSSRTRAAATTAPMAAYASTRSSEAAKQAAANYRQQAHLHSGVPNFGSVSGSSARNTDNRYGNSHHLHGSHVHALDQKEPAHPSAGIQTKSERKWDVIKKVGGKDSK